MSTENFLRGRRRGELSLEEEYALETAVSEVRSVPAGTVLVRDGELLSRSTMLVEGLVGRYVYDRDGQRQLVAVHVAGDFVDLHGFPLQRLDHEVATLSPACVAFIPHEILRALTVSHPHLMRMLWFSTLLDAAIHREWIFRLGRLDATGRVAHFFCEMNVRLMCVGRSDGERFRLSMRQTDIADACGLTPVHVNRVLRQLREREALLFRDGQAVIMNRRALEAAGEFTTDYLYIDNGPLQSSRPT